jgi:hypothetical protein
MKKIMTICIVLSLLSLAFLQSYGKEPTATVISKVYGITDSYEIKTQMNMKKTEKLMDDLETLKKAIEANDTATSIKILSQLEQDGIVKENSVFEIIKTHFHDILDFQFKQDNNTRELVNLLCVILGYGEGLFIYPLDFIVIFAIVVAFGLMPLGILLVFIYSFLWIYLSHSIPLRTWLPITMFGLGTGEITTLGLRGIQKYTPSPDQNISAMGVLIGYIGIVINILIPPNDQGEAPAPFFCLGYSLAAFEIRDTD